MVREIIVKLIHNKKNGQVNISVPKRKLTKKNLLNLKDAKFGKIKIEELY